MDDRVGDSASLNRSTLLVSDLLLEFLFGREGIDESSLKRTPLPSRGGGVVGGSPAPPSLNLTTEGMRLGSSECIGRVLIWGNWSWDPSVTRWMLPDPSLTMNIVCVCGAIPVGVAIGKWAACPAPFGLKWPVVAAVVGVMGKNWVLVDAGERDMVVKWPDESIPEPAVVGRLVTEKHTTHAQNSSPVISQRGIGVTHLQHSAHSVRTARSWLCRTALARVV